MMSQVQKTYDWWWSIRPTALSGQTAATVSALVSVVTDQLSTHIVWKSCWWQHQQGARVELLMSWFQHFDDVVKAVALGFEQDHVVEKQVGSFVEKQLFIPPWSVLSLTKYLLRLFEKPVGDNTKQEARVELLMSWFEHFDDVVKAVALGF